MKRKIETVILAILFSMGLVSAAKAEAHQQNQNTQATCDVECSAQLNNQASQLTVDTPESFDLAQIERRTRASDLKKTYLGGTVGFFLPSDSDDFDLDNADFDSIDIDTGFGGSAYIGYKLNNFLSADLELLAFTGNAEPFDSDYTSLGFFINPRYTLPIGGNPNASPFVFLSPGIGVAGVGFGDDIEEQISEDGLNTGVALQVKAGAGLPLSESIDVIGQARYFNAFSVYEISDTSDDEQGFSSFSLEAGLNFKL